MKQSLFLTLLFAAFLGAGIAKAEDERAGSARAAMEALRPMAGEWRQMVYNWRGDAWSEPAEERATFNFILNDLALRKLIPERAAHSVRMETTIQFDQYRNIYRMVAMDDAWGNMDIYEGKQTKPGQIVFDNIRPGTYAKGANGEVYYFRLTLTIDGPEAHQLLVEISSDEGASWNNFQRLDRTRL